MIGRITVLALALMSSSALAQDSQATAFGADFCAGRMADDMSSIEARLSPDLAAVLAAAMLRNDEIQAAHPDEKPPLGDGIPWSSWPDQPDACAVTATAHSATHSGITIRYSFADEPEADYEDTLVVMPDPAGAQELLLDDVLFVDDLNLSDLLRTVTETAN